MLVLPLLLATTLALPLVTMPAQSKAQLLTQPQPLVTERMAAAG
jgi:hypothetical protein